MRGHIEKRGKRSWRLKWDVGRSPTSGKRLIKGKTVVGTKREAEAELARVLSSLQQGTYVDPNNLTLGEVIIKWRDEVAAVEVAANTFQRYSDHVDRLVSGLGTVRIMRLQPLQIEYFYNQLRKSGNLQTGAGLSEQTLLHIHKVLGAALGQAVRWRMLALNPINDVRAPRPVRIEMKALSADESKNLLEEAKSTNIYLDR
jgi:integrase